MAGDEHPGAGLYQQLRTPQQLGPIHSFDKARQGCQVAGQFGGQKSAHGVDALVTNSGNAVEYEYSDGNTTVRKSFEFSKDSYRANIKSVVLENNVPLPHVLTWRGGFV